MEGKTSASSLFQSPSSTAPLLHKNCSLFQWTAVSWHLQGSVPVGQNQKCPFNTPGSISTCDLCRPSVRKLSTPWSLQGLSLVFLQNLQLVKSTNNKSRQGITDKESGPVNVLKLHLQPYGSANEILFSGLITTTTRNPSFLCQ